MSSRSFTTEGEHSRKGDDLPSGTSDWSDREEGSSASHASSQLSDFLSSKSSARSSGSRGGSGTRGNDARDEDVSLSDSHNYPPPSPSGSDDDEVGVLLPRKTKMAGAIYLWMCRILPEINCWKRPTIPLDI